MYLEAVGRTYSSTSRLVALCDSNPGRLELAAQLPCVAHSSPRLYAGKEFDRMIAENRPQP